MMSAVINASSNGNNTIVSGVSGRRIRVLGFFLSFSGTVTAQWQDSGSNNLSGSIYGAENTLQNVPIAPNVGGNQLWWFATTARGQDLVLNLSAAIAVGGVILYDLVP